jgi:hypothetical protein
VSRLSVGTYGNRAVKGKAQYALVTSGRFQGTAASGKIEKGGKVYRGTIHGPGGEDRIPYSGQLLKAFLPPNLALQGATPKNGVKAVKGGPSNKMVESSFDAGGDDISAAVDAGVDEFDSTVTDAEPAGDPVADLSKPQPVATTDDEPFGFPDEEFAHAGGNVVQPPDDAQAGITSTGGSSSGGSSSGGTGEKDTAQAVKEKTTQVRTDPKAARTKRIDRDRAGTFTAVANLSLWEWVALLAGGGLGIFFATK